MLKKNKDVQLVTFSRRLFFLGGLKASLLGVLIVRLVQLQFYEAENFKLLSDNNRFNINLIPPSRGKVLDRKGRILSTNTSSFDVEIIPEWSSNLRLSLNEVSKIIPLTESKINEIIKASVTQKSFYPITIRENLDRQAISRLAVNSPYLPGVQIKQNQRRIFPQGSLTVHVTGYVGKVSASELSYKFPELSLPGIRIGKTGIELQYDHKLRGKPGRKRLEVNAVGKVIRSSIEDKTIDGDDIYISLDVSLQTKAIRRLQAGNDKLVSIKKPYVLRRLKSDNEYARLLLEDRDFINQKEDGNFALPEAGSIVVMDIHSGEIISLVSSPGYDPNKFDPGISAADWELLSNHPRNPMLNKAISGQYSPGSTFKMIVALAALESGVINQNDKVFCSGHVEFGEKKFHCWNEFGHGNINVVKALARSCDVFFYQIALKTGINKIAEMSRRFGLGSKTGIDLSGERNGLIPDRNWKKINKGKVWRPGETVLAGIGQGYVLSTPIQLAVMTSRIANGGKLVQPRLYFDGEENLNNYKHIDINVSNLRLIQKSMEEVTFDKFGTGRNLRLNFKNYEMAGKTGTVQVRRISSSERENGVIKNEDLPWKLRDHSLYVGYAPIQSPKYAISVIVEHGGSGSSKAGPIARDIMRATLKEDPTKFIPDNPFSKPKIL